MKSNLCDSTAERAALGCVLTDPRAMYELQKIVDRDDFDDIKHRLIYEAMIELHDANKDVNDFILLKSLLSRDNVLESCGGTAYLAGLYKSVPSALRVREYACIIRDWSRRRAILKSVTDAATGLHDAGRDVDEITTDLIDSVRGVDSRTPLYNAHDGAYSVSVKVHHNMVNPLNEGEVRGLSTGLAGLDKMTGGLFSGNVYYTLAVTHCGKTWLLLSILCNIARAGGRVVLFSLEMSGDSDPDAVRKSTLWERIVLSEAGVTRSAYLSGRLTQDELDRIDRATDVVSTWDFVICDSVSSYEKIAATCNAHNADKQIDAVGIDYLKLIEAPQNTRAGTRNEEIGTLTRRLQRLAGDLNTVLIIPHQISDKLIDSRSDKRPQLSDGYESGHLSQDAGVVIGLYRDELYNDATERPRIMDLLLLKDRPGGNAGMACSLYFHRSGRLTDAHTHRSCANG
jgi:replicative DNA helicase